MKKTLRQKLVLSAIPALSVLASGCSTEHGLNIRLLDISSGSQTALYYPNNERTESDKKIFEKDSEPYNKNTVTNELWKHYQSRM